MKASKLIIYILILPVQVLSSLFCVLFVNWWAPMFSDKDGNLPAWMKWVQTFDNTLDAGEKYSVFGKESIYLSRMMWLYRNNACGFDYWPFGIPWVPANWTVRYYTPTSVGFKFYATSIDGYWQYRYSGKYFAWSCGSGKAWNMTDDTNMNWKTTKWGPEWRIPYSNSISVSFKNIYAAFTNLVGWQ